MRRYPGPDGKEKLWFDPGEIDVIMEAELRRASLHPTTEAPVVDVERFIERHLKVALDQYAELEAGVLGLTQFVPGQSPRISINKSLTGSALDEDESEAGVVGRWRSTLAHEAAHVILHRSLFRETETLSLFDTADRRSSLRQLHRCMKGDASFSPVNDWREFQANEGMAAILMPRPFFLEVAKQEIGRMFSGSVVPEGQEWRIAATLARFLGVSKHAATIRLATLRLTSPKGQTIIR